MTINIKGFDIIIDDEDYERIMQYKWYTNAYYTSRGYFYLSTKLTINGIYQSVSLHRFIIGGTYGDKLYVDHINGNTLDNRKCNLRKTDSSGNMQNRKNMKTNTSGYKGVSLYPDGKYHARIRSMGKKWTIGQSEDPVECARMYDMVAIKMHGEYARINFDKSGYSDEEITRLYNSTIGVLPITNTSGYRGICRQSSGRWSATVCHNNKTFYLGTYDTQIQAARAYDIMAYKLKGEKAQLNFPENGALNA